MANAKLGTKAVGSIVKLKVNGTAKEFIVVHQGLPSSLYDSSCEGTWLLMKDIYENRVWNRASINKYESSEINTYLNGTFLNLFDSDIRDAIKQVKIPFRKYGGSSGIDQSGANGLPAKIFLLSGYEVGLTTSNSTSFPVDGAKLSYFESGTGSSALNKRIAYLNGSAANWWLRSPLTGDLDHVWDILSNGNYDGNYTYAPFGIRPALVFPQDMGVDSSGNVTPPPPPATHKTLINGTAYTVKGGKCMVDGTVYNILKGRTLIDGTGWDITFQNGYTWVINDDSALLDSLTNVKADIKFVSNGESFDGLVCSQDRRYSVIFYVTGATKKRVWDSDGGWAGVSSQAYRTITFDEEPSGDLLTWLQANATPQ